MKSLRYSQAYWSNLPHTVNTPGLPNHFQERSLHFEIIVVHVLMIFLLRMYGPLFIFKCSLLVAARRRPAKYHGNTSTILEWRNLSYWAPHENRWASVVVSPWKPAKAQVPRFGNTGKE